MRTSCTVEMQPRVYNCLSSSCLEINLQASRKEDRMCQQLQRRLVHSFDMEVMRMS